MISPAGQLLLLGVAGGAVYFAASKYREQKSSPKPTEGGVNPPTNDVRSSNPWHRQSR